MKKQGVETLTKNVFQIIIQHIFDNKTLLWIRN